MEESINKSHHEPWNKGKLVGQKAPFKLKDIWAIRVRLQLEHRVRELAMFDLGLDSKLRACDLVKLKVRDICHGERVAARAIIMQQKTARPVQFEITEPTREAVGTWIKDAKLRSEDFLFPSRIHPPRIWGPASTLASSTTGCSRLVWTRQHTEHIP
jgi:integrase